MIKMNRYPTSLPSLQKGVVLIESLIAVLIFSIGVLALAGLQAAMIKNTDDARYRAEATFVAQQVLGEIWSNARGQATLGDYAVVDQVIGQLPNGLRTVAVSAERVVTVTVTWQLPGNEVHRYETYARVEGI